LANNHYHNQFIFFQSLCDFLAACTVLFTGILASTDLILVDNTTKSYNETVSMNCRVLASVKHFTIIASRGYNLIILLQILYLLRVNINVRSTMAKYWAILLHIIVCTIALSCTLIPFFRNEIGPGFSGCNIRPIYKMTEFYTFTLPISIFWVITLFILYIVLKYKDMFSLRMIYLRSFTLAENRDNSPNLSLLLAYMVSFLILWLPLLILRFMDLSDALTQEYLYFDIGTIIVQGVINGIIWATWRKKFPTETHSIEVTGGWY